MAMSSALMTSVESLLGINRPADDAAAVGVENSGAVEPSFAGLDSSDRRNTYRRGVAVAEKRYTEEQKEEFFRVLDRGGTVRAAARAAGVHENAV